MSRHEHALLCDVFPHRLFQFRAIFCAESFHKLCGTNRNIKTACLRIAWVCAVMCNDSPILLLFEQSNKFQTYWLNKSPETYPKERILRRRLPKENLSCSCTQKRHQQILWTYSRRRPMKVLIGWTVEGAFDGPFIGTFHSWKPVSESTVESKPGKVIHQLASPLM